MGDLWGKLRGKDTSRKDMDFRVYTLGILFVYYTGGFQIIIKSKSVFYRSLDFRKDTSYPGIKSLQEPEKNRRATNELFTPY